MVGSQIGKAVPDSLNRTYSAGQIATLSKLSHGTVEELVRFGLLNPRGGLFGFRDLADNSAASRTEPPFVRFEAIRNRIVPLILHLSAKSLHIRSTSTLLFGSAEVARLCRLLTANVNADRQPAKDGTKDGNFPFCHLWVLWAFLCHLWTTRQRWRHLWRKCP